jgi:DNA-binding transcriptional regulator PaaX
MGSVDRRIIVVQGQPQTKSMRPYLKNNLKAKRAGGLAQAVECLPSKCKALNSKP